MDLKTIYSQLEEKWYGLLDAIDSKGIPVYKAIDPIENAGIPSLPLVAGILIVFIAIAAYMMSGAAPDLVGGDYVVTVLDTDGNAIKGATVAMIVDADAVAEENTNSRGEAYFSLDANKEYQVEVTTDLCGREVDLFDTADMDSIELTVECVSPEFAGCSSLGEDKLVTQLADDQNNLPAACTMRVYDSQNEAIDHPFKVTSNGELDISGSGSCPEDNNRALIDCQYHKWEGTVSGMYNELQLFGQLTLVVKEDVQPETPVYLPPVEITRDIYVKVQNTQGTPLEGTAVSIVDSNGDPLPLLLAGVVGEAITDATGSAKLVLPDQQEFHVHLEDANGAYQPYTSASSYKATLTQTQNQIILNMANGFETTIYVKEEARQTAIADATVTVMRDDKVISQGTTSSGGSYKVSLLQSAQYQVDVTHPQFFAGTATVTGALDQSVFMSPIDATKTGTIIVDTFTATGVQEEFPQVRLQLYSKDANNTRWMSCITPGNGRCVFSKVKQGTYYITATPPGAISEQSFPAFQVVAQNTTVQKISVMPNQLTLTVLTEVMLSGDAVRKKDVEVTLWNADYNEPVDTKESGTTRKVDFTLDQGTRYFLVAEYVDTQTGTKYGPVKTSATTMTQHRKTSITLTRVSEEVDVTTPFEIEKGTEATLTMRMSLPEYRPNQPYESATMEMFLGDPGSVQDIKRTPFVIQPIHLSDVSSQEPFVASVEKADEYQYESEPKPDNDGVSKYIKITIGHYTQPTTYTVDIPVYAKALASSGEVKISYRATWTAGGEEVTSNEGLWAEKTVSLVGDSEADTALETGDFYSYEAYFSKQLAGGSILEPDVPNGSPFYLHVKAKARSAVQSWSVDANNLPDKAEAVAYSGSIKRAAGGTVEIAEFALSGSDFTITNSEEAYGLEKDDELTLVVALRAKERGKGTLTLFGDYDNSLSYEVTREARVGTTPIAGVEAMIVASSNFCIPGYDNGDESGNSCYMDYPEGETLPTNNKDFRLQLSLTGEASANVLVEAADSTIKFADTQANYYETTVDTPKTLLIEGHGTSLTDNLMSVYIWEAGGTKPTAPAMTVVYGPVDYRMLVTPFNTGLAELGVSETTDEIQVKIMKGTLGTEQTVTADAEVQVLTGTSSGAAALVLSAEPYYKYTVDPLLPPQSEEGVSITADSPYFGRLEYESGVSGLEFIPKFPALMFEKDVFALGDTLNDEVEIKSTWDEPVHVTMNRLERDGWDILMTVATFSSSNVPLDTKSGTGIGEGIDIPAGGRAEINLAATAKSTRCRLELTPTILELEVDKVAATPHYTVDLKCQIDEGEMPSIDAVGVGQYVAREDLPPGKITADSCAVASDGDYAFVCDAEQLSVAIAKAADALFLDPSIISDAQFYAFGNDEFGAAIMDTAVNENTAEAGIQAIDNVFNKESAAVSSTSNDLWLVGDAECGIVQVTLEKMNLDEDIKVTFTMDNSSTWCNDASSHYIMGLMNYDKTLRPDFGSYMSFQGEAQLFLDAIAKAKEQGNDIDATLIFGHDAYNTQKRTGQEAMTFFTYQECEKGDSSDCPTFAAKRVSDDFPVIGYYHVTDRDDILIGMVYDEDKIVGPGGAYTLIPKYRMAFAKAMTIYFTTGLTDGWGVENSGWPVFNKQNFQMTMSPAHYGLADQLIDLTGPVLSDFKIYGYTPFMEGRQESMVGSKDVDIEFVVTGDPDVCFISNLDASGQAIQEIPSAEFLHQGSYQVLSMPWELMEGSGLKWVSAYCVNEFGIPSHKLRANITLDDSKMKLVRPLPRIITTNKAVTSVPTTKDWTLEVRDRYSPLQFCQLKLPDGTYDNIEECDDNNDGKFEDTVDTVDNNNNGVPVSSDNPSGPRVIEKTDIASYLDGCCKITPKSVPGEAGYYFIDELTCWSPFITEMDAATEVELECRDESGNTESLGTVSIWRYSDDKPDFEVPEDFIMSTDYDFKYPQDRQMQPSDSTFHFNLPDMPSGAEGKAVFGDFELEPVDGGLWSPEGGMFEYSFTVFDMDGFDPSGPCEVDFERYTVDAANAFSPDTPYPCTGEPTEPGSLREQRVTCEMPLLKDYINRASITCTDLSAGGGKEATKSFELTWDEKPAEVLDASFDMEALGVGRMGGGRAINPEIFFDVQDDYSNVESCKVEIGTRATIEDAFFEYACELQDKLRSDGNTYGGTYKHAVCSPIDNSTVHSAMISFHEDSLKVTCTDEVKNLKKETINKWDGGIKTPTIDNMYQDLIDMCRMVRDKSSAEEIEAKGYIDLGDKAGSIKLDDGFGSDDIDEDGVAYVMAYQATDKDYPDHVKNWWQDTFDSPWAKEDIAEYVGSETKTMEIGRSAECATGGAVDVLILGTMLATGGTSTLTWEAAKQEAQISVRHAMAWAVSTAAKTTFSTTGAANLARYLVVATVQGYATPIQKNLVDVGMESAFEDDMQSDVALECNEEPGMTGSDIVEALPVVRLLGVGIPDEFQAFVCAPEKDGLKPNQLYYMVASAKKFDFSGIGSDSGGASDVVTDVVSIALDSCDDFVCVVGVVPMDRGEGPSSTAGKDLNPSNE
ncbi:hypothetical protein ACFLQ2_00935 [archaeon]